ncbi:hypothetical protein BTUL_0245g00050 [Botrytis tulipae]|uniref:Transcription factor domain-containing protein n=1 Tax=Botrytis tulipae TaxID=87230 RepID=A0A4Z1EAN1_9HELO|nr:hypothetical protein BTUL_0245g00050 [Botrytis tulipae]
MRLAVEMSLHLDAKGQQIPEQIERMQEVRLCTFWGAFSLNQAWSLTLEQLPQLSQLTKLTMKPIIIDALESSSWIPYTDDSKHTQLLCLSPLTNTGALLEKNYTQPSNIRSVCTAYSELSEIIHKSSYLYDSIPAALRLGQNFTPCVLFCYMYYHYAVLLLFRPFIKLTLIGSAILPRNVCDEAADAIPALVKSYSQLYTLRQTPSFIPYFIFTTSITHLIVSSNTSIEPEKFLQGISDLTEMNNCHGFASHTRNILLYLVKKWKIPLPKDGALIAETDLNTWGCPNIEIVDMMKGIGTVSEDKDLLFWLFPIQEQPLLAYRQNELRKNGFALLQE